ncbi:MAG: acyl-ACP desaturase [Ilumatobacteraceae bacterium]
MPTALAERDLMHELTPVAEQLVHRHYDTCKPWYPHEFVPWEQGRAYPSRDEFDLHDVPLPDELRSALFVNLLTEDNLPYYFHTIDRLFGRDGIWREWSHRWVAEEARHAQALRDYALVSRALDPWELEDARMAQMCGGQVPNPPTPVDGFVYVSLQELATRIAHRNTAKSLQTAWSDHPLGQAGYQVISRVAADENFHFLLYRDLTSAALEIAPSIVLPAIERQVREFAMPGTGIPGFRRHADLIARAGIYNLDQHHAQILEPVVLKWWKVETLQNLTAEAEAARDALLRQITRIGELARRIAERARDAKERAKVKLVDKLSGLSPE